ncbi:MAG: phosphatase PAP2 family protein [Candidatus Odinarchaeia archaeon]
MNEEKFTNTLADSWKLIVGVILLDVGITLAILILGNIDLFLLINTQLRLTLFDPLLALIANFGAIFLLIFALILFMFKSGKGAKSAFFITVVGFWISLFLGYSLKTYFGILRPYEQIAYTRLLVYTSPQLGDAFPSSHALIAFFIWTIIAVKAKKYRYPTLALAAIMGFSRIYVGVHFPLDITVGALLGIVIAVSLLGVEYLYKLYKTKV